MRTKMKIKLMLIGLVVFISLCSQACAAIIDDDWAREIQDGLRLMTIEFDNKLLSKDGPFTIYSGPGKQYTTLAENIESPCIGYVAGAVGNWLLMDTPYGIGYVYFDDLQNTEKVKPLRFPYVAAIAATDDCRITRTPYGRWYGEIIQEGTPLIPLAEYENCLYVESTADGVPIRGFIQREDYSFAEWKSLLAEAGYYVGREVDLMQLYREQYTKHKYNSIASGYGYTVGVKSDGTCVAKGLNDYGQCNVQDWENIIAVSAGNSHVVGLKADGTVVAAGDNSDGQCDVQDWVGIVAICAGSRHTVGLTAWGDIAITGDNSMSQYALDAWEYEDIVQISADGDFTAALTSDGRVLTAGLDLSQAHEYFNGIMLHGFSLDTSAWRDIVYVSAGDCHVVGLKADGTVVGRGETASGQLDAVHSGIYTDVMLVEAAADATYVVTEDEYYDPSSRWKDVQFIDASQSILTGVRSDGTVMSSSAEHSSNLDDVPKYDLSDWHSIGLPSDSEVFSDKFLDDKDIYYMYYGPHY